MDAECAKSLVEVENNQRILAKKECKVVLQRVKEQFDKSVRPFIESLEAVHRQQVRSSCCLVAACVDALVRPTPLTMSLQLAKLAALQQQHDLLVDDIGKARLARLLEEQQRQAVAAAAGSPQNASYATLRSGLGVEVILSAAAVACIPRGSTDRLLLRQ